ncbi:MAG: hypothetical protein VKP62_13905 [Candidatus Sericytochromatia bacterium]|nr:hypothetical protein [Candidatus Sericytochromatia bacterium]
MNEPEVAVRERALSEASHAEAVRRALALNARAGESALYANNQKTLPPGRHTAWRIAPEPYALPPARVRELEALGSHLLSLMGALNKLYADSVKGRQPAWVHQVLDQGKPEALVDYQRMNRFKNLLPRVIRPDLVIDESGQLACCELDSIPGGIGLTAAMSADYAALGCQILGGADGLVQGYAAMIRDVAEKTDPNLAIVVSEESDDYWLEQQWLGDALQAQGLSTVVVRPGDLRYDGDTVRVDLATGECRQIDVIYRFFELFDLKNLPRAELVQYANKKAQVVVTPPYKAFLEEKLSFALYHHPALRAFWRSELSADTRLVLDRLLPRTWLLDPAPLPAQAVIPDLQVDGAPIQDWMALAGATKRDRAYVLKPSGFSALAWGSHGVAFGHDLSSADWELALRNALTAFPRNPYILQAYRKPEKTEIRYYDFRQETVVPMAGRARLCPYYFVVGQEARLSGVLSTICPLDKLAIHGMTDAVMVPTTVGQAHGDGA